MVGGFKNTIHHWPTGDIREGNVGRTGGCRARIVESMDGSTGASESNWSSYDESGRGTNELHRRTRKGLRNEGKEKKVANRSRCGNGVVSCTLDREPIGRLLVGDTLF